MNPNQRFAELAGNKDMRNRILILFLLLIFLLPVHGHAADNGIYLDNTVLYPSNIIEFVPIENIVFTDEKGEEVGCIDWSDGIVKFKGNVEESARIFFEYMFKQYILK